MKDTMDDKKAPISTSDVRQPVRTRMGASGQAAIPPTTLMQQFDKVVEREGDSPALFQKVVQPGKDAKDTDWTMWTFRQYREAVDRFGKSLIYLGCQRFDIINIIGFNSPEWLFSNFGAISAGCIPAGIYTTNPPEECCYISQYLNAKVVVCEGVKQLEKYYEINRYLPELKALVMYGTDRIPEDIKTKCPTPVYTFESFLDLGKDVLDFSLHERTNSWKPSETCTLIYTSGTTGPPKAVMITNDNITWTAQSMLKATRKGSMDNSDVIVSYLPLTNMAAQLLDMHAPLITGCRVYFAQADALKGSLGATVKEVRPTMFFGVPRVWEKIYEKMQEISVTTTGIKAMLLTWAKAEAASYWAAVEYNGDVTLFNARNWPLGYYLARILLRPLHRALGFDRCYAFYAASAKTELKILRYFASIDIPIMEIFGQSECTGPHSLNQYSAFKFGTVGRPLPGTETKIDPETGELCYRGRHVFAGYMGMPGKTAEAIDEDGWLHSGDVANIDTNTDAGISGQPGFISITGRIKELIMTAGGENIPPVSIEDELKSAMPALSNVMVIGDKRKFLTALYCLHVEIDSAANPTTFLSGPALVVSKEIGSKATTTEQARNDPKWRDYLDAGTRQVNNLAPSKAHMVEKWALLPSTFSQNSGELTPTLKLKRSVTAAKYSDIIDTMYADESG